MSERSDLSTARLTADFQRRYEPNFAWKSACSVFACLPGLRGLWPMSSFDENGDAYDLSGQGRTLSYNGNPTYSYADLIPYIDLDGVGDFLSRADEAGLDITGTESYVGAAKGLTLGGWYRPGNVNAAYLMSKMGAVGNYSYWLQQTATVDFQVSVDGTNVTSVSGAAPVANAWKFIVGCFYPSTYLRLYINDAIYTNAVAIPASIFNGNGPFQVGAGNSASPLTGRASLQFLCCQALSATLVRSTFEQTRAMFGA